MKLKTLVLYSGLYGGSAAALRLFGFVVFVWLARRFAVPEYAKFGLLYAMQQGVSTFACAGIVETSIALLKHGDASSVRWLASANVFFVIMGAFCLVFVFPGFLMWGNFGDSWLVCLCAAIGGILLGFSSMQSQLVRLRELHVAAVGFSVLPPLTALILGGAAVLFGGTVDAYFVMSSAGIVLALLSLCLSRQGHWSFTFDRAAIATVTLGALPYIVVAFFGWLSGYGNNYIVKALFAPVEIAKFTFALMISSIMQLVATALNQVWNPRFFKLVHEVPIDEIERQNRRFYFLQGAMLGAVGAIILACYPLAVHLVGGNLVQYKSLNLEIMLLLLAYVVLSPFWHCQSYYFVFGKGREMMNITLLTSIAGIVLWVGLMWTMGPLGIYLGFVAQMLLRTVGFIAGAKRHWPLRIIWEGVAAGTVILLVGYAVSSLVARIV